VRLSVCCLTADPGPQVATLLAPLREVADEVVVAADARVPEEDLSAYASLSDRLLRFDYRQSEAHLAWLHAQCEGDWILRIDGDEVASPALIEQLPRMIARRDVHQYMLPRRWLYPDGAHWLDELPWWPDFQVRLVRNDGQLRFSGRDHTSAEPVHPLAYAEAPLLHLDLLLTAAEQRERKALAYDRTAGDLAAPGGGTLAHRFYLPERHARRAPVPLGDAERDAALAVLEPPAVRFVPVHAPEVEPAPEGGEGTLSARIEPFESHYAMAAGERRPLFFTFANQGGATWPWDPEAGLPLKASYRWRHPNGQLLVHSGLRSSFPADIPPGSSALVAVWVQAPARPGRYRLEVDGVHEQVRWFGRPAEVWVEVSGSPSARDRRRIGGATRSS
jgi:hypothetical protein